MQYGQVFDPGTNQTAGSIRWDKTTTTTTTTTPKDANGNLITANATSTTTTTGESAVTAASQAAADQAKAVTQCDKFPNTLGCQTVTAGTEPTAVPLVNTNTTMTITALPVSDVYAGNSACPAPMTASILGGQSLSFSWQPMCTFADGIKPVVIGLAWVGAMFAFMGIGRKEA
jgi:hypothetical protein